ncbi:MAG TPA: archaetidylserine decarboxylase [Aggregatilineaceae bacterium]|nr:archaetidylserine decarboxylase [Aggregatilineaceae bacterium]
MHRRHGLSPLILRENLNFLLANRIPRLALTRFMGWFSRIEQPLVCHLSISIWKRFADLRLAEARKTAFISLHDCFIRELKPGARPIALDPDTLVSPCDGIVGACGQVEDGMLIQAKGFPYALHELLADATLEAHYRSGTYVTLRLKASMYHRFHAPDDCHVHQVTYISGDTWNVNPIALKRIEKLFCKNERAVIQARLANGGDLITLVPVAAILVASIRLHCLDRLLHIDYRGPRVLPCNADYHRGEELGWFQHGSTLMVFAPPGYRLCDGVTAGMNIQMGRPLLQRPDTSDR